MRTVRILLVEDNPGDIRLTQEAFKESRLGNRMDIVQDGIKALAHLRSDKPRPDIILMDLNLPRMNGLELLREIKNDPDLRQIPIVVLTTSDDEHDVWESYDLHVNCYVTKPVDMGHFVTIVNSIQDFWFSIVRLPSDTSRS